MSDFIAQIQAVLDTSKVEAQLKNLQKNQKIKLDVELSSDGTDLGKLLEKQMSGLNTTAMKTGQNIGKNFSQGIKSVKFNYDDYFKKYKDAVKDAKKLEKDYNVPNKIAFSGAKANQNAVEKEQKALNKIYEEQQKKIAEFSRKFELGDYKAQRNNIQNKLEKYSNFNNQELKQYADEYEKIYSKISKHFNKTSELSDNNLISEFNKLSEAAKKFNNEIKLIGKPFSILDATTASNKTLTWINNNTKAAKEFGEALTELANKQKSATSSEELADYNKQFKAIVSTVQEKGTVGNSFWTEMKRGFSQIGQFVGVYGVLQNGVDIVKQMAQAVIDVDTAMTELRKVSNASDSQLDTYFNEAAESAKKYGSIISDVISSTADWSRLGYSLEESKKLSDITTLYQRVGDNMTQESASTSLVSTLQGYKLTADEAEHIVDAFNEVGNNFAIGSDGIGEALRRSASSMYAAGNTMEQTIGLVTAANEVVQDPASIGTAFKTVSMRIRGAETEMEQLGLDTEGMVDSTAKLQKEILALTGINIMKDKDTFKSTYDILDELSSKWKNLTDIQQASVTELIAGKRQGNIISALMSNFDTAREATNVAYNSTGSAKKELENYQKGIQYSIDKFKSSFQNLSNTTLSSDLFKGVIDSGTAFLDILTNILDVGNGIPALLGTIGAVSFFKNLDLFYKLV